MAKNAARIYLEKIILQLVPTPGGQSSFWNRLESLGDNPTTAQLKPLWKDIVSNTPLAGRIARQFSNDDPYFLKEVTPAGTDNINRLPFSDLTLNSHAIDDTFSIIAISETLGNVSSVFDIQNPNIFPNSLAEAVGNFADIRPDGVEPISVTDNTLVDKIGTTPITPSITDRSSIIASINMGYTHKTPFLLSFCKETPITSPSVTTFVAVMVSQVLKPILDDSGLDVSGGGGDDMTKCILGAAKIALGNSTYKTITQNICPTLTGDPAYTCALPPYSTFSNHAECVEGTSNYLTSINDPSGGQSVASRALNDPHIKQLVVGEICAQYID